jgi:hypothetical protein
VLPTVSYDSVAGLWKYAYTVANGSQATQAINRFGLQFNARVTSLGAPAGWDGLRFSPRAAIPGASFSTVSETFVTVTGGFAAAPTTTQIAPGSSLAGFLIVSAYPPGQARTRARGYAAVPFLPDSVDDEFVVPHDTTDAQRGWSLGPTRYTSIVTRGTYEPGDTPAGEPFVSFMNVDTAGTVLRAPAVIAIKFMAGTDGSQVLPQTFRALLNNVDVTSLFHPGPSDGADRVAIFMLGAGGPLATGVNTLRTIVGGVPRGVSISTTPSLSDSDVIHFTVQP